MQMCEKTTSWTYDIWAWFYDRTFGALVKERQRVAVQQLRPKAGDRVLDFGVGTGMTLGHYPKDVTVVGCDLSHGMLQKACRKLRYFKGKDCHLIQADAMAPPFAEQSFDHVLICHTVSVVSDPQRMLNWAMKLVKPGGRIVILNHFQSTRRWLAWLEKVFNPFFIMIGWRSDLSLEELLDDLDVQVDYHFKLSSLDLWQIVVLKHDHAGAYHLSTLENVDEVDLGSSVSLPQDAQPVTVGA